MDTLIVNTEAGRRALRLLCALALLLGAGCSTRQLAAGALADALAQGGSVFASDDDPELVKAALPTNLKLMESLLEAQPRHAGLLTATAGAFAQYAYAFVQQEADEVEDRDLAAAEALRDRARRLYLRAQRYSLRALDVAHPGFADALHADPAAAAGQLVAADVPAAYWTAAAWAGAIALGKDQPDLVGQLPAVAALMDRAQALDEAYDGGAIPSFMITFEMSRPGAGTNAVPRARRNFERAVALSGGREAGPYVALAEAVTVQQQDVKEFEALLGRALAVDADANPGRRLANLVMQRRARWLLERKADLFLPTNP